MFKQNRKLFQKMFMLLIRIESYFKNVLIVLVTSPGIAFWTKHCSFLEVEEEEEEELMY